MSANSPRVVVITRKTEYELLIAQHATPGQAEFFLASRGRSITELAARHHRFEDALHRVMSVIPADWRRNRVRRDELDRFLFETEDLIIAIGQDGLVANVSKYLNGQRVIGVNPDKALFDGILVPFSAEQIGGIIVPAMQGVLEVQQRTMVSATLDDGQQLLALNELFLGHRSHQSARYQISAGEQSERHSSSGIIISTGTGATGWARSIHRERHDQLSLPMPEDKLLAFYVREAFPSVATGTSLTSGLIGIDRQLQVQSEMNQDGVIFGDGIESDYLDFDWGRQVRIRIADRCLNLVRE